MTDTDLFTAGSADSGELPNTVTATNSASSEQAGAPAAAPAADEAPAATRARRGALTSLVLPELRAMAKEIGVEGASGMRKSELIAAIRERRGEANGKPAAKSDTAEATAAAPAGDTAADSTAPEQAAEAQPQQRRRERRGSSREQGGPNAGEQAGDQDKTEAGRPESGQAEGRGKNAPQEQQGGGRETREHKDNQGGQTSKAEGRADSDTRSDGGDQQGGQNRGRGGEGGGNRAADNDDDGDGRQGRRGRRFRDRRRRERGGEGGGGGDRDTELREDDVVQPVAGILDVLDNYAFVRTSGYLAGPNDVYVSMNMVRKNGLRRGDAVTGAVRVPKDGEQSNQRQKFNPLVRLDSVNGGPVEEARKRPEFQKLTPLYPNTRLRLETSSDKLTTRVIDLIMPIGKGQRALIVSPPKAGKTTIM